MRPLACVERKHSQMAEFASHELLGTIARVRLPLGAQDAIDRQPTAYYFGLQGPDPLFYYGVAKGRPLHKLGNRMHSERTEELFATLAEATMHLTGTRGEIARAYFYGFLGHYALDSTLHPYVYYLQQQAVQANPKVHPSAVHCGIESDMESALYQKTTGKYISTYTIDGRYEATEEQLAVMAVVLHYVLKKVYGVTVATEALRAAFGDMLTIQKMFYACDTRTRKMIARTEKLIGQSALLSSRLKVDVPLWDCLNLERKPWKNLWHPEVEHTKTVLELFDQALLSMIGLSSIYAEQFASGWVSNLSFYAPFDDGNCKALGKNLLK